MDASAALWSILETSESTLVPFCTALEISSTTLDATGSTLEASLSTLEASESALEASGHI